MKKLLSIMIALVLVMSVGSINAFAQEVQESYYDENWNLKTVTIDTEVNPPIELEKSSYTHSDFPQGGVVLEFTEPCVVYAWISVKNSDQSPGQAYPVDMALDYEMRLGDQNAEYINIAFPQYGPQYGDYEYLRYTITARDLVEAGGSVSVYWNARAVKYREYSLKDLQQTITLGITAYSGPPIVVNPNAQTQVKGTYREGGDPTVYSVDVTWGSMEYVYYANKSQGIWDPDNHTFGGAVTGSWSCETGEDQITVTNHSNAAVKADFVFKAADEYSAITGSFTGLESSAATLPTAVGTVRSEAPAVTTSLVLDGALDASTADSTPIGTVTVIISAA